MATSRFVQITDKEINKIKINSILKNMKDPTKFGVKLFQGICFIFNGQLFLIFTSMCKNTKTIIRLRLSDFQGIFSLTSSRQIFPDNHLTFGE